MPGRTGEPMDRKYDIERNEKWIKGAEGRLKEKENEAETLRRGIQEARSSIAKWQAETAEAERLLKAKREAAELKGYIVAEWDPERREFVKKTNIFKEYAAARQAMEELENQYIERKYEIQEVHGG